MAGAATGPDAGAPSRRPSVSRREIDRLLTRLGPGGTWHVQRIEGSGRGERDPADLLRLVAADRAGASAPAGFCVSSAILREARARDLIERGGAGGVRLSEAGRARLRRSVAGDDGFRVQHQERGTRQQVASDGAVEVLAVDHAESPLAWLRNRKGPDGAALIDAPRFEAGERLRADVTFGRIVPGLATQSWDGLAASGGRGAGGSGIADLSDAAVAARMRVERALAAIGPELAPVVVDVCCELKGLSAVEKARRWPPRSAKVVLLMGLARLARHYGLMPRETGSG